MTLRERAGRGVGLEIGPVVPSCRRLEEMLADVSVRKKRKRNQHHNVGISSWARSRPGHQDRVVDVGCARSESLPAALAVTSRDFFRSGAIADARTHGSPLHFPGPGFPSDYLYWLVSCFFDIASARVSR